MDQVKKKRLRKLAIWLLSLAAIIFLAIACINIYFAQLLEEKIVQAVSEKSGGYYTILIEDVSVGIIRGNVELEGLRLIPDSTKHTAASTILKAEIASIELTGLHAWDAWKNEEIRFASLTFSNGEVLISRKEKPEPESKVELPQPKLHELIGGYYRNVSADMIALEKMIVSYRVQKEDSTAEHLAVNASLQWEDVLINAEAATDTTRTMYARNISLTILDHKWALKDSAYTVLTSRIHLSTKTSSLKIDSLAIHPNYEKDKFSEAKEEQSTRITSVISGIELQGLDIKKLLEEKSIVARKLQVGKGNIELYKNKRFPPDASERKPLPQQALRDLSFPLAIDSIVIGSLDLEYERVTPQSEGTGRLTFNDINASFGKISNDENYLKTSPACPVRITTRVMEHTETELRFVFPLTQNKFTCTGVVTSMNLPLLNAMLYQGSVSITQGSLDKLTFDISFTDERSTGTMLFAYHDLRMEIHAPGSREQGLKEKIISTIAKLKIPGSNPEEPGKPLRIGTIDYIRDKNKSVFTYIWKSLQTGLLSSLDLDLLAGKVKNNTIAPALED